MRDSLSVAAEALLGARTLDALAAALDRGVRVLLDGAALRALPTEGAAPDASGAVLVRRPGGAAAFAIELPPDAEDARGEARVLAAVAEACLGRIEARALLVRRALDLARMHEASRGLAAAESVEDVVSAAATGLTALAGGGILGLYTLHEGVLGLTHFTGEAGDFPATVRLVDKLGDPLLGAAGVAVRPGFVSLLGRPAVVRVLAAGGETLGALVLRPPEEGATLDDDALALVEALAEHVALALRGAQLLAASRREAAFDALTGLASRRQFLSEMAREVERVRRQGTDLSMLLVDADHFKAINDTWGHSAGDAVLKALAEALLAGTRTLDVVGRLGGEELGVLLPSANLEQALHVAERLRARVERAVIDWRGAQLRVTVSIGVAEWEAEMVLDDLVEAADLALYEAKRGGRNRIMAAPALETLRG